MVDPLSSPLSVGLRFQTHSQAKSLPTCVQGTRDKISNFGFKIFQKSRQLIGSRDAHARHNPGRRVFRSRRHLSLERCNVHRSLLDVMFTKIIL